MEGKLVGGYVGDRGGAGAMIEFERGGSPGSGLLLLLGFAAGAYLSYKLLADAPLSRPTLPAPRRPELPDLNVVDVEARDIAEEQAMCIARQAVVRTANRAVKAKCSGKELQVRCDGMIHVVPVNRIKCFARRHLAPRNPSMFRTFLLLTDDSQFHQVTPLQDYLHFASTIGPQTLDLRHGAFSVTAIQ